MIGTDSTPKNLKSVSPVNKPESPAYMIFTVNTHPQFPGASAKLCFAAAAQGRPTTGKGTKGAKDVQRPGEIPVSQLPMAQGSEKTHRSRHWLPEPKMLRLDMAMSKVSKTSKVYSKEFVGEQLNPNNNICIHIFIYT